MRTACADGWRQAATALLVASAGAASAQPAMPSAPPPGPSITAPAPSIPAARWTLPQLRQAFDQADADSNGVLNRAEAQQLPILPRPFEDLDRNKDGALVLDEYLAGAGAAS